MGDCRECREGHEHCHGTLIRHTWQRAECTETGCPDPDLVLHSLVIDCDSAGCECDDQILRTAV
ncbi:MAG: hypothetical protein U0R81_02130 [Mycobacterium sp.]